MSDASNLARRLESHRAQRDFQFHENQRLAFLREPAPVDPRWNETIRIKRIGRGFSIHGRPVALNEVVSIARFDGESWIGLGRAELVE